MSEKNSSAARRIKSELAQFLWFTLLGVAVLPLAIYFVGDAVFGTYAGNGFGNFYGNLHSELRQGQPVVWFLLASPYLVWLLLRLTIWAIRRSRMKDRATLV